MGEHSKTRAAKLDDASRSGADDANDTAIAMALLWVIPVFTFVYLLTRM